MTYSALAVLLGMISLALTQCTMTGDNITGVGLDRSEPTTCVKQCNDQYALLFKQEQKTHDENIQQCQALRTIKRRPTVWRPKTLGTSRQRLTSPPARPRARMIATTRALAAPVEA